MIHEVDTLVIGAGLIGSSVAMHLAKLGAGVRVVDFDLDGSLSSSELNAGGVRATWNLPINIQQSILSIDYFATVAEDVGYRPVGYLWLQPPERIDVAMSSRDRQLAQGWSVEAFDAAELRRRVPFIDKTDGIAGCTFAPRDGLVNPNLLKLHYRNLARAQGVVFDNQVLVRLAQHEPQGIRVTCEKIEESLTPELRLSVLSGQAPAARVSHVEYRAKRVVNCAGPWAGALARILGYPSPSFPVRRQVCIFDSRDVDLSPYGMIIDTTGVYFHPEATHGLAGFCNHDEPRGVNFEYDGEKFFMETIWPALHERSTKLEQLRHMTGWAGQYECSPDDSAIIGRVTLGEAGRGHAAGRVFEAHSFSGHGVMHCHAAGLALAELMVGGRYQTLDLTSLGGDRFETGKLVKEGAVI